jgi:hypothetical protein
MKTAAKKAISAFCYKLAIFQFFCTVHDAEHAHWVAPCGSESSLLKILFYTSM